MFASVQNAKRATSTLQPLDPDPLHESSIRQLPFGASRMIVLSTLVADVDAAISVETLNGTVLLSGFAKNAVRP